MQLVSPLDRTKDAAAPIFVSSSSPVYRSSAAKSMVENELSSPCRTMAEFIMRIAVSRQKPASMNFSIKSTTRSLSLLAAGPDPIPSDRQM